ncbi:MAG: hypothetical protein A2W90_07330 [Bacteroidetes bacterium GWF2_42_66]|nr:MAG: hypothetical protein A2W92_07320 [Bacteroidetes bacterium GWA2_42_15]OFX96902.1 MAG: hypothetical protein A2W89_20030 [Bacteroidetes bacterium GWE2_42_39]OFY44659.1 MAG: hypothetical protein A2W90_07330 [Bacteroidetes bacterium GWF2_42_66]HAZ01625.1 hypothetical protein [Marinilabiliales bacterium]HBL75055.1 hypothetical protein [Prolixibacteraceae bacterium]
MKFLIVFVLFFSLTYGAPAHVINNQIVHVREIYKAIDTIKLAVDIFYSEEIIKNNDNTAILFFHGGGWASGSSEKFFTACERYARKGVVAFAVNYRLSNEGGKIPHKDISPIESLMDAKSVVRWVRSNADKFGIDINKIVVSGQSAGGHLAISTAMIDEYNDESDDLSISCYPNTVVLFSAAVNTVQEWCDYLLAKRRDKIWSISPAHHIKEGLPPMIHFHGSEDHIVPFWSVRYFKRDMENKGNLYELITCEGKRHLLAEGSEEYSQYFNEDILKQADEFLYKHNFLKRELEDGK